MIKMEESRIFFFFLFENCVQIEEIISPSCSAAVLVHLDSQIECVGN